MCDGSQLKDAVYDYVSDLNRYTDTTELYYVNSSIIPYKGNLTSYVKDLNPQSFRSAGGNRSNTDLGNVIASVLETVNDSTVGILISDCILDLPAKDAQKYLNNCGIRIKNEIVTACKRVPDLCVEVLKLKSDFNGKYFYPNGTTESLQDVKRPYYLWIFGSQGYLANLNKEVPLSLLSKYDLEGTVTFSHFIDVPFNVTNKWLTGAVVSPENGEYCITIRADFSSTLQPEEVIRDTRNFSLTNPDVHIETIQPITAKNNQYTHFLNIIIPQGTMIAQECLSFTAPEMPSWVTESNDETGANIANNLSKTTGIKSLIQGVADAYKKDEIQAKMIFNIKTR